MGALTRQGRAAGALQKRFEAILSTAAEVVATAGRACEVKRLGTGGKWEYPADATDREKEIMSDALLPAKACPVYLLEHYRTVQLAQRIAAGDGVVPQGIKLVVNLGAPKDYGVIDVTPKGG